MNILHIDCSARYIGSISRQLSKHFKTCLIEKQKDNYEYLDLAMNPPQTITELHSIAMYTPEEERSPEMHAALKASDNYIEQLLHADTIIMAAPMYNFGIPASLKLYFDMIIRLGKTFTVDETLGYKGLLNEKTVVVIGCFGGDYRESSPMHDMNCYESHIRAMLKFMGVYNPHFVIAQPTQFGGIAEREKSIALAEEALSRLAKHIS